MTPTNALFSAPVIVTRDQRTLELRQFYPLPKNITEEQAYSLDVYFFFPRSFGISSQTWSGQAFYRDTQVFLRLHAPLLTLKDLSDLTHPENPLGLLSQRLPLLLKENAPRGSAMTALAQMFGAELGDTMHRQSWLLQQAIRDVTHRTTVAEIAQELTVLCDDSLSALTALRRVKLKARAYQGVVPPALLPSLAFAEEYVSAVLDESLSEVAFSLEQTAALLDGSATVLRMRLIIAQTLEILNRHRREEGYVLPHTQNSAEAEHYTYRMSLLKKELQRALYVDTRALLRDPFVANSVAMVAAGIAATWATLAQIPILTGRWQTRGSLLVFGAAVGAYVLKDRIKDWVKALLSRLWLPWDHDHAVVGDALAEVGLGAFSGRARERLQWITESDIPYDIIDIRAMHRTVRGSTVELEQVAHYQRLLSFKGSESSPLPKGYGVQEILRLSVEEILRHLDDPSDQVSFFDGARGRFMQTEMPKVYHLNVVAVSKNLRTGQCFKHRSRVILNQRQLLRVEPVVQFEEILPLQK